MAQEEEEHELEIVDVVYCANCSLPPEYCRYNDKNTYKQCLKWLQKKKQANILAKLLKVDEKLASELENLALEEQKQNEAAESGNTEETSNNDTNDSTGLAADEKNPHDPSKQPSKSILKQDEADPDEAADEEKNDVDAEDAENGDNANDDNADGADGNDSNEEEPDDADDLGLRQNFNRSLGIGRNVGRGGKGRRQKGRKGKKKKGKQNDSDSEDDSQLTGKQLKEKQRQKRREELAKNAMVTDEEKQEQAKAEQKQKREKIKADAELIKSKKIIIIGSKKIKGGKVVTLVTGLVELGMKPKRAQSEFRKQFATGVGVNVNEQGKTEVVIQGEHRYDLMKFLREKFGTPAKLLFYQTRNGLEPGFSPEGMLYPPGM